MAYSTGDSKNIIVGAAAVFVSTAGELELTDLPAFVAGTGYAETLSAETDVRNVGFTSNGLELQFQPDFGEVSVDQSLDSVKLFKQGMQVNLRTAFAEATLENLLIAVAAPDSDLSTATSGGPGQTGAVSETTTFNLSAGKLGECPIERSIVAVGPGTGDCTVANGMERIYVALRALSMDSVTVGAKRDSSTVFEVSFRLLPDSTNSYGKMVDRKIAAV